MIPITTESTPPRERADFWADLVSRHVNPMRIEPAGEIPLHGEVQARAIGELAAATVSGRGLRASHGGPQVALTRDHRYAVGVHLAGEARIARRGEQVALQPGDVFITDFRYEFAFDLERPWRHLVVTLPTCWIDSRVARPELISGAVLRDQPLARLLACHLDNGYAIAGAFSPAAATLFAGQSVDLLTQALAEQHSWQPTPSEAWRAAMFVRGCRLVALQFGDPTLTPDRIARGMRVSTRTLDRIFAAHGETVMRRVLDERVRRAAELLTSPAAAHRSVTEIALACGFNDSSHFGRAFVARMHVTPSRWRQQR